MPISYTAQKVAMAITAAPSDLFWLKAPSLNSVAIRRIFVGQSSDILVAQQQMVPITVIRGYTTAPTTGGGTVVPVPLDARRPAFGAQGADEACLGGPYTVLATTGTGSVIIAETWNIMAGWYWKAPDGDHLLPRSKSRSIWLNPGIALSIRLPVAPIDPITGYITVEFDEYQTDEVDN